MKLKPIKVYHYFWIVSMVILIFGLFYNNPDAVFNINVGDTYYVIAYMHLAIALFVIYFSTGVGYWFVLKILKKPLIHYLTVSAPQTPYSLPKFGTLNLLIQKYRI